MKISSKYCLLLWMALFLACLGACKEQDRFAINSDNMTPPSPPVFLSYKPLSGGVRLFYQIPNDEDVLSVDAEYTATNGKIVRFSASYFVDSLDVYGFANTDPQTVKLFATNRAGIRSTSVEVGVIPLESALPKVVGNISVKPAVRSFIIDWENELKQTLNVYVSFKYNDKGREHSFTTVFSSNNATERKFINDLDLEENVPISVNVWIEDLYGNKTESIDKGQIILLHDYEVTKSDWVFPAPGTEIGGVVMCNGNVVEGRITYLNDGIINTGNEMNFIHTGQNAPWNILIDLGDYYELTRIATWQRRFSGSADPYIQGSLYGGENVGEYSMYRWDDETGSWEFLSTHRIPIPTGIGEMEIIKMHNRYGNEAYILPDEPRFTKPTRWFRYEALSAFGSNYTSKGCTNISEMTLWGRKYNR